MNKIKYFIGLMAISLIFAVGCEDLDTAPDGDILTSAQKEDVLANQPSKAVAGVNAIFAQYSQLFPNAGVLARNNHNDFGYPSIMLFTDVNGYDMTSDAGGYNWWAEQLDYSDRIYTSRASQIIWNDLYAIISAANRVTGAISLDTEEPVSQFYLAQGLAARAFCYWNLAQLYQFNYEGNESKPCVPIITDENSNEAALNGAPRATVQEVYTQITTDIDNAIALLSSAEANGVERADKRYISLAVAYGISARVNLAMHKYSDAGTAAQNAIDASEASPASIADVSKPYFSSVDDGNWMWGIIIQETDAVAESGIVNWNSHMGSLNSGYDIYYGGQQINILLYNSMNPTDVRKGWWTDDAGVSPNLNVAEQGWMDQNYVPYTQVKFAPYKPVEWDGEEGEWAGTAVTATDVPLMRIEEMYLIKAEAEAVVGTSTTLESFVTTYRDPAYTVPPGDLQEEVYRQRRIELWGEGLSWYDIMRLDVRIDRRGAGYPNATSVFNIDPGANIRLWRIPEAEIQANPAISAGDNNPSAPAPTPVPDI